MTVETATYISDLNAALPGATDLESEGDDHLRLIKSTVKATFANVTATVTPTHTQLNQLATNTFAGDVTALGVALVKVKTAATARNTTTTLADDPHLVVTLPTGTFAVEAWLPWSIAIGGGGNGFKVAIAFTGTKSSDQAVFMCNEAAFSTGQAAFGTGLAIAAAATGAGDWVMIKGACVVTAGGNLSIQWAQNSSGAQNLTLSIGAYLKCTKLA